MECAKLLHKNRLSYRLNANRTHFLQARMGDYVDGWLTMGEPKFVQWHSDTFKQLVF